MPLPTLDKTWQFNINGTFTNASLLLWNLVDALTGFASNPWTILSGSAFKWETPVFPETDICAEFGTTAGARAHWGGWITSADAAFCPNKQIRGSTTVGANHAWVVLKQAQIAPNFQVCIDLNYTTQGAGDVVVSPSAGFTGGSNTARPTATDEVLINGLPDMWASSGTFRLHVMQSTDGQCTRVFVCRNGFISTFLLFDRLKNPRSALTQTWVAGAHGTSNLAQDVTDYNALYDGQLNVSGGMLRVRAPSGVVGQGVFTTETVNANGLGQEQTVVDDIDGSFPLTPVGVYAYTPGARGRYGMLFDLWFGSTGVTNGDDYDQTANKVLGQLRHIVVPSNGVSLAVT